MTGKGKKREVQILLCEGGRRRRRKCKVEANELMYWEPGVNEEGSNRPVRGQTKRKAEGEKKLGGEVAFSATIGKSNRNLHIALL